MAVNTLIWELESLLVALYWAASNEQEQNVGQQLVKLDHVALYGLLQDRVARLREEAHQLECWVRREGTA
ncbi:MAG: hypothetical protein VKK97_04070 [Synechococcaceae cyanobacterium]|nr:hypothetical protein [Synechococcaceae cyanobacterium]